jgi:flagellar protein FlaG
MNSLNALSAIPNALPQQKAPQLSVVANHRDSDISTAEPAGALQRDIPTSPNASELQGLTELLQQHQQHLSFSIDEGSGATVMRVIDTDSGDIIRQMPTESWLKLAQELADSTSGLLNDRA